MSKREQTNEMISSRQRARMAAIKAANQCGITVEDLAHGRRVQEQLIFRDSATGRLLLHYHPGSGNWMTNTGRSGTRISYADALKLAIEERDRG